MALTYLKNVSPQDQFKPYPAKNEWGVDVLAREVRGSPSQMDTYVAALAQGATYSRFSVTWYLQTWQEIADPIWPGMRLFYKALLGGIPSDIGSNSTGTKTASKSATITSTSVAQQVNPAATGDQVYAIQTIEYYSPETQWRYIRSTKPNGAEKSALNTTAVARIIRSRIEATVEGVSVVFAGNAPAGIVSALSMSEGTAVISHSATEVIGTPWWECMDTLAREFEGDS